MSRQLHVSNVAERIQCNIFKADISFYFVLLVLPSFLFYYVEADEAMVHRLSSLRYVSYCLPLRSNTNTANDKTKKDNNSRHEV